MFDLKLLITQKPTNTNFGDSTNFNFQPLQHLSAPHIGFAIMNSSYLTSNSQLVTPKSTNKFLEGFNNLEIIFFRNIQEDALFARHTEFDVTNSSYLSSNS